MPDPTNELAALVAEAVREIRVAITARTRDEVADCVQNLFSVEMKARAMKSSTTTPELIREAMGRAGDKSEAATKRHPQAQRRANDQPLAAEPPDSPTVVEPEDVQPRRRECWAVFTAAGVLFCAGDRKDDLAGLWGESVAARAVRMVELSHDETIAPPGSVVLTREQALEVRHLLRDSCFEDGSGPKIIPASCVLSDETRRALGIEVDTCE